MSTKLDAKVLIVDDEPGWRDVITRHLAPLVEPKNLYTAGNFSEAMSVIDNHFFHAAVLDIRLVNEDSENEQGMNLLEALYQKGESTGVIMLSGFGTPQKIRSAWRKYNAIDFLEKENFEPTELIHGLEEAIALSNKFLAQCRQQSTNLKFLSRKVDLDLLVSNFPYQTRENFNEVIRHFVVKTAPLLVTSKHESLEQQGDNFIFSTKYWSRYEGKGFALEIGSRSSVDSKITSGQSVINNAELFTRGNISSIKYILPALSPGDFME